MKFSGDTILQGVKFPIFLLIFAWASQRRSAACDWSGHDIDRLKVWLWKPCPQCPLTWWVFVASIIEITAVSTQISRHVRQTAAGRPDGQPGNIIHPQLIVGECIKTEIFAYRRTTQRRESYNHGFVNYEMRFLRCCIVCTRAFLSLSYLSVCPSHAWIVTKGTKVLPTFLHHMKGQFV